MNDYCLGQYEKSMPNDLDLCDKLKLSKEFGFDYLEISVDETDEKLKRLNWDLEEKKNLVKAMFKSEQFIRTMCLSGHRRFPLGHYDKSIQDKSLEIMEKAISLASDLGIRIIQLAGYDIYYEEGNDITKNIFEKNLEKCVYMASKKGIVLAFETMETSFMDTIKKSMFYVKNLNSPFLGIYPDIGNLKNASLIYGHEVNEDLELGRGHIFAAHLKDTLPNIYREVKFGTGHTEFFENVKLLKNMGVRMFTGEFWYTGNSDWKESCFYSCNFLRNILDKAFN